MEFLNRFEKLMFYISLAFVFVVFINFRDIPNIYVVVGAIGLYLYWSFIKKKTFIDLKVVLIFAAMFFYAKIRGFDGNSIIVYMTLPATCMLLGTSLMAEGDIKEKEQKWYLILPVLAFLVGFSGHGILNGYVYCTEGFIAPNTRYWFDFWNRNLLPGTQHSIYLLPMLACFFPAFIYLNKYKIPCVFVILCNIFFLYYSLDSLSRLPILIFAIVIMWQAVLFVFINRDDKKTMYYVKRIFYIGIVIGVLVTAVVIIKWNEISQIPFVANLGKDGGLFNNVRFVAQRSVLKQLLAYPKGGMPIEGLSMAHNVWLDMAHDTGLITFLPFTAYTVLTFVELLKLLKSSVIPELKFLFSGIYIAFLLYYSMEPALNANIQYMIPWIFNNGLISGVNKNEGI